MSRRHIRYKDGEWTCTNETDCEAWALYEHPWTVQSSAGYLTHRDDRQRLGLTCSFLGLAVRYKTRKRAERTAEQFTTAACRFYAVRCLPAPEKRYAICRTDEHGETVYRHDRTGPDTYSLMLARLYVRREAAADALTTDYRIETVHVPIWRS